MTTITSSLFVAPGHTGPLASTLPDYGGLFCSLGYETRSRAIAEAFARDHDPSLLSAAGFVKGHECRYEENRDFFESLGVAAPDIDDAAFAASFETWLRSLSDAPRLAVDISSMTRPRIAAIVETLVRTSPDVEIEMDLLYVPAKYEKPPAPVDASTALEPVIPWFAGWDADPSEPVCVIFGLGYEPERAAGAIDELDPLAAIPYFPVGLVDEFSSDVKAANAQVLGLPKVQAPVEYAVGDPFRTFVALEALVSQLEREESRPLLLPLGPKIFAAVAMAVSAQRQPPTPVWRVSPGPFDPPRDRQPEDLAVSLRLSTRPMVEWLDG